MSFPTRKLILATVIATLLPFALPVQAQELEGASRTAVAQYQRQLPVFAADLLHVSTYTPQFVQAEDLFHTVLEIHGRQFYVKDNGFHQDPPENLQIIGSALMIYDTAEYTQRMLETLAALDVELVGSSRRHGLTDDDLVVTEFAPRHMAFTALAEVLKPFQRQVTIFDDMGGQHHILNITVSQQQGLLVVRDTQPNVDKMRALVARVDVLAPHVTVTCLVLRATHGSGSEDLPPELVSHLSGLVGANHFERITMGLLTTSVTSSGDDLELSMPVSGDGSGACNLRLRIEAFDPDGPAVTFSRLAFSQRGGSEFSTRATLHDGEWLVIGAAGAQPVFVVLRMTGV